MGVYIMFVVFFFQAEDGIRDLVRSRGLGDVYKRQIFICSLCILAPSQARFGEPNPKEAQMKLAKLVAAVAAIAGVVVLVLSILNETEARSGCLLPSSWGCCSN